MTREKNILIIDTSVPGINLALCDVAEKHFETEKQTLDLPGAVENFLADNKINFHDLSAISVVTGPGSFTGIRLGIAYAKGLSIGLNIPIIPINAFEIYLARDPAAFVTIDSHRGDFFVAAHDLPPCVMTIDKVESEQMKYPKTVGHIPYDLKDSFKVIEKKLLSDEPKPAVPLYMRASYAEIELAKKC